MIEHTITITLVRPGREDEYGAQYQPITDEAKRFVNAVNEAVDGLKQATDARGYWEQTTGHVTPFQAQEFIIDMDPRSSDIELDLTDYTLPAHWASALVNGDESGMSDEDCVEMWEWLNNQNPGHCVDVGPVRFATVNDANNLGGDVAVFTFQRTNAEDC